MCPAEKLCVLPEICFIGGSTKKIRFNVCNKFGDPVDVAGLTGTLFIASAAHRGEGPIVTISMRPDENVKSAMIAEISPPQTSNLYGKYIYQVEIKGDGFKEEPLQGNMYIGMNIA